ncbi:flagellar biosynthesis protein FlhF [Halomonas sp. 328]|uniref:flagellar biosynthesis protein FlhF n=1 Tax=Halomonas sp. 328 TaxID=2776704 RepID=UPI0018A6E8B0|nr:flagellar biosynthesis protein FlhF [Halomonas sp. 328]MBF8221186.1 flagellar biosynthesis protein FlhF [Halomonas sp. 328]
MSVTRFLGANVREAMRRVRSALGDDALILANRRTDEGIEILAMAEAEAARQDAAEGQPAQQARAPQPPASPGWPGDAEPETGFSLPAGRSPASFAQALAARHGVSLSETPASSPAARGSAADSAQALAARHGVSLTETADATSFSLGDTAPNHETPPPRPLSRARAAYQPDDGLVPEPAPASLPKPVADDPAPRPVTDQAAPRPAAGEGDPAQSAGNEADFIALSQRLLSEVQDMRQLLTREPPAREGRPGALQGLQRQLVGAGFGHALTSELLASLPTELALEEAEAAPVQAWLRRSLAARLTTREDEASLFAEGGVLALVGPTGVGKTTTTAKLAARYVMRHGPEGLALVTTDSYRIGAHEQLRIYADILGVEVHALDAETPLEGLLERLADKALVIIDTVGMSQRDQRLVDQVARLQEGERRVRLMLMLSATSQGETLEEIVLTYRRAAQAAGARLEEVILTKQDEAARLGPLLDALIRHGLRLNFVCHGQQVPEDMARADGLALVEAALENAEASPSNGRVAAELPRLAGWSRGLAGQSRALGAAWQRLQAALPTFQPLAEAWQAAGLPLDRQAEALERLWERETASPRALMRWARRRPQAQGWRQPDLRLDDRGLGLGLPSLQHRQPADEQERLAWADDLGVAAHLLPGLPSREAWDWLGERVHPWLAQASGSTRVWHRGERLALGDLTGQGEALTPLPCRHRQGPASLELCQLPVAAAPAGSRRQEDRALWAWLGVLKDDAGRPLGQRYWLSPAWLEWDALELLRHQLALESLERLTRRAWQQLPEAGLEALEPQLRLTLAAGLAGLALGLEQSEAPWALDLRGELLALQGGRRTRSAGRLLDGLLQLLAAREALRGLTLGLEESR